MNNQNNNNNRNELSHRNESKVNINGQMKILESKRLKKRDNYWFTLYYSCKIYILD